MRILDRARVFLRTWLRPASADDEFRDELQFHLERQCQANIEAGMTPAEALRAARLTFGHVGAIREYARDARAGSLFHQALRDISYGWRLLRRSPRFAVAGVLIVALGIGATTAIFSVLYGVVLRPLDYPEPSRLVSLWTRLHPLDASGAHLQVKVDEHAFVNAADYQDWRAENDVFDDIALVRHIANFNLVGNGEPERLFGARVSPNLFSILGVTPAIGRSFAANEDRDGSNHVVLLSDGLWRQRFGGDPSIVGRTITLSGEPYTVVGVMKPDFRYPGREYQLWVPLTVNPAELARQEPGYSYLAVARLRRGVPMQQAQSAMTAIAKRLESSYPATNGGVGVSVKPLLEDALVVVRPALYIVLGAVACLLLVGCLNLANLLGARAAARAHEFSLRAALGASRGRLALQALAEVTPMLALGGVLGVGGAAWVVAAFIRLAPATLPRVESIALDGPVLAFSAGILLLSGLAVGLVPALQACRSGFVSGTREQNRSATDGRGRSRTRSILVVAQIALVLPLLVGAALLARSFASLMSIEPGFRSDNVLSLNLAMPRSKYPTDEKIAELCGRIVQRVAGIPGVASAGMVNRLPLGGVVQTLFFEFEERDASQPPVLKAEADSRTITPDYFRTMGIPLVEGRALTEHDIDTAPIRSIPDASFPTTGIIDEQLARRVWPGRSAIGRRFRVAFPGAPWTEVVGVVGHLHNDGLEVDPRPQVYFNYLQRPQDRMALVVRGKQDIAPLTTAIIQAVHGVDPEQPVYDVRTLDEVLSQSTAERRLSSMLVAAFAIVALILAGVGLYASIAYGVASRTREFGIRMAFGAGQRDIVRLVLTGGARLAFAGAAIGLAAALVVTRAMAALLFGVRPLDLASFASAAAMFLAVALLASYVPARRAAAVDPAIALSL